MHIPVTLLKDEEQGGYTVICDLLCFTTEGDTLDEALANAKEAATCSIEGMKKEQNDVHLEIIQSIPTAMSMYITV